VTGATRILLMFSVATVTVASPVYLRLWESPGPDGLLRLMVLLQILPTTGLILIDVWLERRWRRVWWGWRGALCAFCVLTSARQAQVSSRLPIASGRSVLVVACVVVGLVLLAVRHSAVSQRVLVASAPGLLVWTFALGYYLLPVTQRTTRQAPPPKPPAVFVLLFDELDRDVVMPQGRVLPELPNFRRLVERSRAFGDATANYGWTCASVGSLLTGRLLARPVPISYGCLQQVPGLRADNLLTDVARRLTVRLYGQYLTYCFDASFECRGTAYVQKRAPQLALLQHYVPDSVRTATGAERILSVSEHVYTRPVFEQFLADVRAADARGAFHWLHVLLPHAPYVFDAQGAIHRPDYGEYWRDPTEYRRVLAAYRRQVAFVDWLLGRFLDRLETEGLAHDAIIVVTSDHGFLSLHPPDGQELIDGFDIGAGRLRVPLIIRAPGVTPGLVADEYQHIDFRRLVLGLIDSGVPGPIAAPREKIFCDSGIWYVRDAAGRWRPQLGLDGGPRACAATLAGDVAKAEPRQPPAER